MAAATAPAFVSKVLRGRILFVEHVRRDRGDAAVRGRDQPARRMSVAHGLVAAGVAALVAGCSITEPGAGRGTADANEGRTTVGSPAEPVPLPPEGASQAQLDEALRAAAWADRLTDAETLIGRGADVNAKDGTQQSAYLIATSEGHLELLDLTLRHGAKVDDKDSWNGTGLIRAAERGHHDVVGHLLRAGVAKDHVNRIGYQAVHEAVWLGEDTQDYVDTLRVLVAGGVELERASGSEGLTPLEMARQRGYARLEAVLARATSATMPADPDRALLEAAERGDADAAAIALRAGADLETRDDNRRTPLLLAAAADHLDVARLLVDLQADPDALDAQHDTPWLVTGVTGSVEMLEVLLPAHPDLTIVNRYGGVSVIPASERGHVDYVRRVVTTGIDVDHVNRLGWTALLEAVILGDGGRDHQEVVRALLEGGADRDITDADGRTPLQHAEAKGQKEVAAILRGNPTAGTVKR
jgi:ankyrin repeat protein